MTALNIGITIAALVAFALAIYARKQVLKQDELDRGESEALLSASQRPLPAREVVLVIDPDPGWPRHPQAPWPAFRSTPALPPTYASRRGGSS